MKYKAGDIAYIQFNTYRDAIMFVAVRVNSVSERKGRVEYELETLKDETQLYLGRTDLFDEKELQIRLRKWLKINFLR